MFRKLMILFFMIQSSYGLNCTKITNCEECTSSSCVWIIKNNSPLCSYNDTVNQKYNIVGCAQEYEYEIHHTDEYEYEHIETYTPTKEPTPKIPLDIENEDSEKEDNELRIGLGVGTLLVILLSICRCRKRTQNTDIKKEEIEMTQT